MDTDTRAALEIFLCHLTHAQTATLMDVLASHVENVETDCDDTTVDPFIVALTATVTNRVATLT